MKRTLQILGLLSLVVAAGCDDDEVVQASSLEGPRAAIHVRGEVCVDTFLDSSETVIEGTTRLCEPGERGNLGLVVSSHDDRLGIIDLYPADYDLKATTQQLRPRFLDIDPATPGVTHLEVGRLPVDVAASPSGRVAYTLDQLDRTITVVDLLETRALETRYHLKETPIAFAVAPDGSILTISGVPSTLTIHEGTTCGDDGCSVPEGDPISLSLGGTATHVELTPDGSRAFVTFRDIDQLAVVALTEDGVADTCLDAISAPCTTAQIPLTWGCRDGIDNDGDGRTDRDDPQCLSPLGGEAPGVGPSRALETECNDGIDNDEDGVLDLDDPECIASGGLFEEWDGEPVVTPCNDGIDNDGDGLTDLNDSACYSAAGRTESLVPSLGFDSVSVDSGGFLAWVLDTANSQVLVVDAKRLELIDVPALSEPGFDSLVQRLGIRVPSSPISIEARVDALNGEGFFGGTAYTDPFYYRTNFSAWVGTDNGQAYNIVAVTNYCEVSEAGCVLFPEFPLQAEEPSCGAIECTCTGEFGCPCDDPEFIQRRQRCGAEGQRVFVNPIFDINQATSATATVVGFGTCAVPGTMVDSLNAFALANPGAPDNPSACTSDLLPQPRGLAGPIPAEGDDPTDIDLEEIPRADLLSRGLAAFDILTREPVINSVPFSARITNESWTVAYEGVLPRTQRADWLLPLERSTTDVDGTQLETITLTSSTDLCAAGVEVGDLFVLDTEPLGREACAVYTDEQNEDFRTYRIVSRDARSLTLTTIEGGAPLPVRAPDGGAGCYESGVSGGIVADDTWVVSGDRTGYLSRLVARHGLCVDSRIGGEADGRVQTGEVYRGPTVSFQIYPGFVAPERGLQFEFETESNFTSDRLRLGPENTETVGLLPYDIHYREADDPDDVEFLLATDPDTSFVYVRSLVPVLNDDNVRQQFNVIDLVD